MGDSPVAAGESSAPLTPKAPNSNATWNLTDILWGISRLQSSPQKLTADQSAVVRSTVSGIIKGTNTIKNFENEVKSVLTAEQLNYVEYLESTGALDKIPNDLPDVEPGQDPLVQYVISVLEKK
ncbi:hypothetical protein IJT17_03955 [bacterium]|nr:hypothetical protein [bacterium]